MKLTEENLRFHVAYTVAEYWSFPDIDRECFDWEGDERVEQTLYGTLNARQFLWLIFDRQLTETIATQGIEIENGYIIPAVDFYEPDEDHKCYVSVYTDEMLKTALKKSDKPSPVPVLQNDLSVKNENLSFVDASNIWYKLVAVLPEIVESFKEEEGNYPYCFELDEYIPRLIEKLNNSLRSNHEIKT